MKPIELTQALEGPERIWINPDRVLWFGAASYRDKPVTIIAFVGYKPDDGTALYVTESPDVLVALLSRSD